MKCFFCICRAEHGNLCSAHHAAWQKVLNGTCSEKLKQITRVQRTLECFSAPPRVLLGYSEVPTMMVVSYYIGVTYQKGQRYIRDCDNPLCCNYSHLSPEIRTPKEEVKSDLFLVKDEIQELITAKHEVYSCIHGPCEINGEEAFTYWHKVINVGRALLTFHIGKSTNHVFRLCETRGCYNHRHYIYTSSKHYKSIVRKRSQLDKPNIDYAVWYKICREYDYLVDATFTDKLTILSKKFDLHPQIIQAAIIWRPFR